MASPPESRKSPAAAEQAARAHLNLHLHQLAYVVEVQRTPTLTEAARRLGVSQPALSQSLSELERRIGVPLFERTGRQRTLTEAGREFARFAAEVLGRADRLDDWLAAHREGEAGRLHVGMIDAASLYVLPEVIGAFRRAHPGVRLRVTVDSSTALLEQLTRFDLDLAFVIGPVSAEFEAREVLTEPLYLYGPRDERGRGQRLEMLSSESEWALYPTDSQTRALIDAGLAAAGLRANVTLESGNPQILRQMVALGLGWSVLPSAIAEELEPALRRVEERPVAERTLFAVWRREAPHNSRAAAFLDLVAPPQTDRGPAHGEAAL